MEESTEILLQAQDLSVAYGGRPAVERLSLSLSRGDSLGLLGANGAGKTSTIRAFLGLVRPREGKALLRGREPGPASFAHLGFAPEEATPPEFLTGREYLYIVGGFRLPDTAERRRAVEELLEWFELDPRKRVRNYSKGMRRRLVLAQAFLGDPELLILDEPLNGLDPLMILKLRERLDRYRQSGRGTVLFSSHILAEVEKVCTHAAILVQGRLTCLAPVGDLVAQYGSIEQAFSAMAGGSR